ncbi:hypothetical protein [Actinopolymorpha pittospori]|uniref:Uncharacterized protein n=1 Tax=Actinopolymorpha pittospori TaxID=648752 RepID=A0A927MXI5_9ACTN|nr:hypothetical protein [Actinopolymorpha pittospori]MBE1608047.1 hypothetical protein [Actinopolymorpha pittospori]
MSIHKILPVKSRRKDDDKNRSSQRKPAPKKTRRPRRPVGN